jgi:hypothetical protein
MMKPRFLTSGNGLKQSLSERYSFHIFFFNYDGKDYDFESSTIVGSYSYENYLYGFSLSYKKIRRKVNSNLDYKWIGRCTVHGTWYMYMVEALSIASSGVSGTMHGCWRSKHRISPPVGSW